MTTLLLVRHGRTTANRTGVLAGRTPGVDLDEVGVQQARVAAERIAGLPLAQVVTSPLRRCRHTTQLLTETRQPAVEVVTDARITECGYGTWSGRPLKELAKEKLWRTVQTTPSAVRFPDGESMTEMSSRAVSCVRERDAALAATAGDDAVWVAVSHGDVIKAILADALGMHLDAFQRIMVDPASISVVRFSEGRPFVVSTNTTAGDLSGLKPPAQKKTRRKPADAAVGGGLGSQG
jgi:probable phosphomutase (TIGR03848 family)